MKTQTQKNKRKSMLITAGVHSAIFMAAMIPVATQLDLDVPEETQFVIPIEFAQFAQSNDESQQAASTVPDTEVKPVVEDQQEEPDVIDAEQISDVAQATEEVAPVESQVMDNTAEEEIATEDIQTGDAEETASEGGSEATVLKGDSNGTEATGDEEGHPGLDGTGVITRKVIHREDITPVAKLSGVIAINLCIDRRGHVVSVAKNEERTTITDTDLLWQALDIATRYRFETDYSAAKRECGVLTFIFEVDDDAYEEAIVME